MEKHLIKNETDWLEALKHFDSEALSFREEDLESRPSFPFFVITFRDETCCSADEIVFVSPSDFSW
jgi:hypothetical protein